MSDLDDIRLRGYLDPTFYMRMFLPHWCSDSEGRIRIPWIHRGMLARMTGQCQFLLESPAGDLDKILRHFYWLEDPEDESSARLPVFEVRGGRVIMHRRRYQCQMIGRGFAKTTMCNVANLWAIHYAEIKFLVYASETATHAKTQLGNIRGELENNEGMRNVFGNLVPDRQSSLKWTDDEIETTSGVTVVARGRGGQIRGLNTRGQRPDRIVLDDVEDKESVKTEEQREKAREWLYGDVIPALPEMDKKATIFALGTLLHADALLRRLQLDPSWGTVRIEAEDEDGEPVWPEMMDAAKLEERRLSYTRVGMLRRFYMEYYNTLRGDEGSSFTPDMIRHRPPIGWEKWQRAIALDPAISEKAGADYAAIAVVARNLQDGHIWVLDVWMQQGASPREIITQYFHMAKGWRCQLHGVESIAYQAALIHLMKEEMARFSYYFEPLKITHAQRKQDRVEGILQPRYAAGYITHAKRFTLYESQLLDWPVGKHDDGPDVVSMAVGLLDPTAMTARPEELPLAEEKFEELEDLVDGDWRIC